MSTTDMPFRGIGAVSRSRSFELDSIRGLAALVVLTYHALAVNLSLFARGSQNLPVDGLWANLIAYSPLRLLWSGGEAVWVFFVLSGFVLTRPALSSKFPWVAYYPSRLVRIYIPVFAAITLTFLSIRFLPHVITDANSYFLGGAATEYSLSSVVNDAILVTGPTNTLGTLWSLRWEVLFSLLLPAYIYLAKRRLVIIHLVVAGLMIFGFLITNEFLMYMPMFYFGASLAVYENNIELLKNKIEQRQGFAAILCMLLLVLGLSALSSHWTFGAILRSSGISASAERAILAPVMILGILLILTIAQMWKPLTKALSLKPVVFLGTVSFSLYLVHWPVVITTSFLIGPGPYAAVIGFAASIALAIIFYFLVEKVTHAWARNLRQKISRDEGSRIIES